MKKVLIAVLLFMVSSSVTVYSQFKKGDSYFGVYASLVPSKVDYAKNMGSDASYIKMGYSIGVEKTSAIGSFGLGWVTSLTFIIQPYDQEKLEKELSLENVDFKYKPILNIPLMTGLKFQKNIVAKLELYGQAQIGLNIHKMGNWKIDDVEMVFDIKPSLGYTFGGGIIINERFNLGVRYYMLGDPEVEAKQYLDDGTSSPGFKLSKEKINLLSFVFGINF